MLPADRDSLLVMDQGNGLPAEKRMFASGAFTILLPKAHKLRYGCALPGPNCSISVGGIDRTDGHIPSNEKDIALQD